MFSLLEGNPRGPFIMFSPLEGNPRGPFIMFSPLEGNPRGNFIMFSPLEGNPRGHFIMFPLLEGSPKGTLSFLHRNCTSEGTFLCCIYHKGIQQSTNECICALLLGLVIKYDYQLFQQTLWCLPGSEGSMWTSLFLFPLWFKKLNKEMLFENIATGLLKVTTSTKNMLLSVALDHSNIWQSGKKEQ